MLLALVLAASTASCPITHARYQVRGDPGVTARFQAVEATRDWPSGLALAVRFSGSGRAYWFLPWQGGTDGRTNLAWVREAGSKIDFQTARGDLPFLTTDGDYNLDAGIPYVGGTAPIHILIPDLNNLTRKSTLSADRDRVARAFFDIVGCHPPEPDEPGPTIAFPGIG